MSTTRLCLLAALTVTLLGCKTNAQTPQTPPETSGEISAETTAGVRAEQVSSVNGTAQNGQATQEATPAEGRDATLAERSADISTSRETAITRAVREVAPAVVSINVTDVQQFQYRDPFEEFFYGRRRPRIYEKEVHRLGSGFVISEDGYIVTNAHVAAGANEVYVAFPDGTTLPGELVGSDELSDIAVVKVEPEAALPYLTFEKDESVVVGEWVIALGNPFGLFEAKEPSVTVGVVSATGRDYFSGEQAFKDMIQTDAAINSGNSGGPLVNALGRVIGVNTFIVSPQGGSVGLGFAVPARRVERVVEDLRAYGQVDRSFFTGLNVADLNARIARVMKLDRAVGILIQSIDDDSPAEDAGLEPYDVITSIDGKTVENVDDARKALVDARPGDTIPISVIRSGREREFRLKLARRS